MPTWRTPQRILVLATSLVLAILTVLAQAAEEQIPENELPQGEPAQQQFSGSSSDSGEERPTRGRGLPDFQFPKNNIQDVERPPIQDTSSKGHMSQDAPK